MLAVLIGLPTAQAEELFWDGNGVGAGGTAASPTNVGGSGTWNASTPNLWYNYDTATYQAWTNSGGATVANFAVSSGTVTIASGLTINANRINGRRTGVIIAGADSTSTLNLDGTTPTISLTAGNAATLTISANISGGAVSYVKSGDNPVLTLSGNNTFTSFSSSGANTGAVYVLESSTALGTGAASLSAGGGGTVSIRGSTDLVLGNDLTANASATFGTGTGTNNGNLTFGTWTRGSNGTITINNNITTFTGLSSGGTVTKTGAGALIINGSYSHSGAMTMSQGAIAISGTYGQSNNGMTISGGGQLGLSDAGLGAALTAGINTSNSVKWGSGSAGLFAYGSNSTWGHANNNLTVAFGGIGSPTALTWSGNGSTGFVVSGQTLILGHALSNGTIDFRNDINLNGASQTVQVNKGSANTGGGNDAILSGALSSGGLVKTGTGQLLVSNTGNSYSSGTTVGEGTLVVTGTLGTGNVSVAASAVLQLDANSTLSDSATLDISVRDGSGNDKVFLNFTGQEVIGSLILGGETLAPGVYDATTHGSYFVGSGAISVPEPGSLALFALAAPALLVRRRRERNGGDS